MVQKQRFQNDVSLSRLKWRGKVFREVEDVSGRRFCICVCISKRGNIGNVHIFSHSRWKVVVLRTGKQRCAPFVLCFEDLVESDLNVEDEFGHDCLRVNDRPKMPLFFINV